MFSERGATRCTLPGGSYGTDAEGQGEGLPPVCFVSLGLGLRLLLYKRGGRGSCQVFTVSELPEELRRCASARTQPLGESVGLGGVGLASECFASSGVSDGGGAGHSSGLHGLRGPFRDAGEVPLELPGVPVLPDPLSVSPVKPCAGLFCRLGCLASDESIV